MSKTVRTLVARGAPAVSKLLKSCVPNRAAAAALHGLGVEPAVDVMPDEMPPENVADRPVVDHVAVAFPPHVADGVEIVGRFGHLQHGDVVAAGWR